MIEILQQKILLSFQIFFNVSMDDLVGKNLQLSKQDDSFDELELLFSKNKDILTDEDKEYMRFIIEKRKREIDKQLGEE